MSVTIMDVRGFILIICLSSYVSVFTTKDEEEILCVYMKSCVLPCRFTPGSDLYIEWTKTEGDLIVLSFHQGQNQDVVQYQDYRNRTSLFEEELNRGNASLLLGNVTFKDQGQYLCLANDQDTFVNMKVFAPVSQVHVYPFGENLICHAQDIYPEPSLKWTMDPEPSAEPQTSVYRSKTGLFSVRSSVPLLPDPPYKYTCTVSTEHSTKSETYEKPKVKESEPTSDYSPLVWGITCPLIAAALAFLAAWWCKKRNGFQVKSSRFQQMCKEKTDAPEDQIELEEFPL